MSPPLLAAAVAVVAVAAESVRRRQELRIVVAVVVVTVAAHFEASAPSFVARKVAVREVRPLCLAALAAAAANIVVAATATRVDSTAVRQLGLVSKVDLR